MGDPFSSIPTGVDDQAGPSAISASADDVTEILLVVGEADGLIARFAAQATLGDEIDRDHPKA